MVTEEQVSAIGRTLLDAAQPLPARFRALFTLRNLGGPAAVACIGRAFGDGSALLKHELAYCLGQMRDEAAIPVLLSVLRDTRQEPMVRHEAGTAPREGGTLKPGACPRPRHGSGSPKRPPAAPGRAGWPGLASPRAVAVLVCPAAVSGRSASGLRGRAGPCRGARRGSPHPDTSPRCPSCLLTSPSRR